ncbi:hypothetical protein IW262DRAFT_1418062 [Armillaria fumosa]|nr:hypothetical protein IW262DRAFT_1418062 [Armillaria fumosa]
MSVRSLGWRRLLSHLLTAFSLGHRYRCRRNEMIIAFILEGLLLGCRFGILFSFWCYTGQFWFRYKRESLINVQFGFILYWHIFQSWLAVMCGHGQSLHIRGTTAYSRTLAQAIPFCPTTATFRLVACTLVLR